MNAVGEKREGRPNSRQGEFASHVAAGSSQAEAYRRVYKPRNLDRQNLAKQGNRIASLPVVRAEIERIRSRREVKKLLTLNDRLEILADIAQDKKASPHEKARAIDVYSRISGDQAPERHEIAGVGGGPIPVAATAVVSVTRIPVRERMAMMRAARAAASAPQPEAKP